ncbi:hypothetical protein FQR65_LT10071 [Abscondita terminalis]|nr:hypothetical protein FQR65_LT10071 [Abscondita terminalis]
MSCELMMIHCHIIILVCLTLTVNASDPIRQINQGSIRGMYMKSADGKNFSAFLGIPYAKPPVGNLRFEPPTPADSWDNVFEATRPHSICTQVQDFSNDPKGAGTEDCLYLNVFTPQVFFCSKTYPVMVFIHGGGFFFGSGQWYEPDYLIDYDVVYVTMNYRLGIFGFLSTGDKVVPGNNGLKDQALALKWVNENIQYFGGDPKRITLFGQSAGLFQYAISQSGSVFNTWAMLSQAVAVERGKKIAQALKCPIDNNIIMIECLKKVEPYEFVENYKIFTEWEIEYLLSFRPVVEVDNKGAFLTEHPLSQLKANKHYAVPWILGFTTEEGAARVTSLIRSPQHMADLNENFNGIMSIIMENKQTDFSILKTFYFEDERINNSTQYQLVDVSNRIRSNPTPETNLLIQSKWEPVATEEIEFSFIERNIYSAKNMLPNRMKFWEEYEASLQEFRYSQLKILLSTYKWKHFAQYSSMQKHFKNKKKSCVIILVCLTLTVNASDPIRQIKQGSIRGMYMKSADGKNFSAFLGIPYAKPPVGTLRFEPPTPADSWDNVFEATRPHPICTQVQDFSNDPKGAGTEDCLYLNVFTPQIESESPKTYPVMVFIHGGGFFFGSGQWYEPDYLIDYDVVYVNMNYRLVPGNNGLKDQTLALKWINENIQYFGGDPKKITIFGQSAGAASVHYHQFSPLSKGLFQYAISQSGCVFNTWAMSSKATAAERAKKIADALKCPIDNNIIMVECLKKVEPYEFIEKYKVFKEWEMEYLLSFKPVVEVDNKGAFLTEHPLSQLKANKHYAVPWILGFTTEEGAARVPSLLSSPQLMADLNENFNGIMSIIMENKQADFSKFKTFYFGDGGINNSTQYQLVDMFSDIMFNYHIKKAAHLHLKYSSQPVYLYMFGHKTSLSFSKIFGGESMGTCHCDDQILQFPLVAFFGDAEKHNTIDKSAAKLFNTLFTNFAKTGNPTPETNLLIQSKWEPVATEEIEFSFIERNIYSAKNMLPNRMKFWEEYEASLQGKKVYDEL